MSGARPARAPSQCPSPMALVTEESETVRGRGPALTGRLKVLAVRHRDGRNSASVTLYPRCHGLRLTGPP
jgi:hypothetical protein